MPRAGKTGRKNKQPPLPKRFSPGFLSELDGRSLLVRELSKLRDSIISDLGGESACSTLRLLLIDRAVWLAAVISKCESEVALASSTAEVSGIIARHTQMVNALQGLAAKLGLEKSFVDPWSTLNASQLHRRNKVNGNGSESLEEVYEQADSTEEHP